MATAYLEYGRPASLPAAGYQAGGNASLIPGPCVAIEALTVSGTAAIGSVVGAATKTVARVTADVAVFYAVGTTPDPSATAANGLVTSAKRYLPSGVAVDIPLATGAKVAVIAVA